MLPLRREGLPSALPPFLLPYVRSRSSCLIFFTHSSTTILTLITRFWWSLWITCVRFLQNHYFMPSHASFYLQPACIIVSRPYIWHFSVCLPLPISLWCETRAWYYEPKFNLISFLKKVLLWWVLILSTDTIFSSVFSTQCKKVEMDVLKLEYVWP